jgi:ubiquinone/menaquinone biosynthesis C-methylase UbiE
VNSDPYRRVAGIYDRIFEPMNSGLRVLGFRMYLPPRGGEVLDVGCGTGVHLDMYRKFGCRLHGVDTSSSMLAVAQRRLGEGADLRKADATDLPFDSGSFDLVFSTLVLHEMEDQVRSLTLEEIKRVVKPDGRILLIDFHTGRPRSMRGWLFKMIILFSEVAAGRRHFRGYRHFMSIGGLPALIERAAMHVEQERIVGEGNMALYLLSSG